jgi:ABC-type transporter Mla MlaB component
LVFLFFEGVAMSERFEWTVRLDGTKTLASLSGPINEDTDFAPLLAELQDRKQVCMDLAGIRRINSCGVREWVNFVRALPSGLQLEVDKCSQPMVTQINMISNFLGSARILSVHAPFLCESCGHEDAVLIAVEKGRSPDLVPRPCPKCNQAMQFDDLEESYFSFLRRA